MHYTGNDYEIHIQKLLNNIEKKNKKNVYEIILEIGL